MTFIFPQEIDILSTKYKIVLCETPLDVDIQKRSSMWGVIDHWKCEIRVFKKLESAEVVKTLLHEIIHGVCQQIKITLDEDNTERLANVLTDTIIRNNFGRYLK